MKNSKVKSTKEQLLTARDIRGMQKYAEVFRTINPEMSITQAVAILEILAAGETGISVKALAERTDITVSAASRNIRALLPEHRGGSAKGLDLINYEHQRGDYRVIHASPNARMLKLSKTLAKALAEWGES